MVPLVDLIFRLKTSCLNSELDIMTESGLSPAEYNCIAAMEQDETICGTAVSHKMNLSPSRASRIIDKMVHKGYLKRETASDDRRRCNICLAEKGILIKEKIETLKNKCEAQLQANLSTQDINTFTTILEKIINTMG